MNVPWQPISSAPSDQWILVYMPWIAKVRMAKHNTTPRNGRSKLGWQVVFESGPVYISGEPFAWAPLPEWSAE